MIIAGLQIRRYKSLLKIQLDNLENIVILTGKNSSGKSNLLEALWLFSKDFALSPESINTNVPIEPNSHLWTNVDTSEPIVFNITFRFTPQEIRQILPLEMINILNLSRKNIDFTIERELFALGPNMAWKTNFVQMVDLIIIHKGLPVKQLGVWTSASDEKKPEEVVPISFISHEEQLKEAENYFSIITPELINSIIENLTKLCKDNIKIIFSARSSPSINPSYGTRTLNIEQSVYNKILSEGQNLSYKIRNQWRNFVRDFEELNPYDQRLNIISGQAIVDEKNISIPLHQIGGGTQGLLHLLHELFFDPKPIIFIEEPENHLHPELQKKFYNYIKNIIPQRSREKQLWISSHSPFFLNKSDINNIWVAKKENDITEINNLMDKEDLKNIIYELGVKPSDILFSDAILLVDGTTEEFVIPIWGNKLGIDLVDLGCDIISIGGESKGKYHLEMWRTITQDAQVPIFMILDSHAKKEAEKLINENKIDEESCIVTNKNSIEEFYDREHVINAIFDEFGIEVTKSELRNTKDSTIRKVLISKGMEIERNWWKPLLGKRVAEMMEKDEIPYDYRRILEKIKITLQ